MIPSRGLRWSGQTLGIGRRRIEAFSGGRQFSSSTIQQGSFRSSLLPTRGGPSVQRAYARSQFSRTATLIRNGSGVRFASTTPQPVPITKTSTTPEAVSSSAAPAPSELVTPLDGATELSGEALWNVPEHIGYLKSLGLDYGYGPTAIMEWLLEHVHIYAGTPWWISISLTALVIRAILFKPYVNAAENAARMATIAPITKPLQEQMMAASRAQDTQTVMKVRAEISRINKKAGIKLSRSFIPLLQAFAGYGSFVLLRAMSKLPVPGLETGGILWFYNLSIPDPYFALPVVTSAVLFFVLKKGGETGVSNLKPQMQKAMLWGLPGLSLLFTWWLPASVQLTFLVSGILSFIQSTLLRQPWFRSFFKMTPLPTPVGQKPASPYKGNLKVVASPVLSQAELTRRFQGAATGSNPALQEKIAAVKAASPPGGILSKIVSSTVKDIKGTAGSIADAGKGVLSQGKGNLAQRKEKSELEAKRAYEVKRQQQLKKEKMDREYDRRAERAAKKAARKH